MMMKATLAVMKQVKSFLKILEKMDRLQQTCANELVVAQKIYAILVARELDQEEVREGHADLALANV